jgi:translation elongation factor EF-G
MGAANGSINQRRGRVEGMEDRAGVKLIKATVQRTLTISYIFTMSQEL